MDYKLGVFESFKEVEFMPFGYGYGWGGYGYGGHGYGGYFGHSFVLIVVLFILLIIVGATWF
jgi:uncharacterized protein (TIGR01732 family)